MFCQHTQSGFSINHPKGIPIYLYILILKKYFFLHTYLLITLFIGNELIFTKNRCIYYLITTTTPSLRLINYFIIFFNKNPFFVPKVFAFCNSKKTRKLIIICCYKRHERKILSKMGWLLSKKLNENCLKWIKELKDNHKKSICISRCIWILLVMTPLVHLTL